VDVARSRNYAKRGAGAQRISLNGDVPGGLPGPANDILALDEALQRLVSIDPRKGQIVELRFFGGLSLEATAEVLKVSSRTIRREWEVAKVWLAHEINAQRTR
jgi:RNA polymerase sigma factor (TIGR02999 family)